MDANLSPESQLHPFFGGGSGLGELAQPSNHPALQQTLGIKDQSLSKATPSPLVKATQNSQINTIPTPGVADKAVDTQVQKEKIAW